MSISLISVVDMLSKGSDDDEMSCSKPKMMDDDRFILLLSQNFIDCECLLDALYSRKFETSLT